MPNAAAKHSSEYLTTDQMISSLQGLPSVLLEMFGESQFTAYYGWATNIHVDLQYKPMRVSTSVMQWFIKDSISQKIFVPGESDLLLYSSEEELQLTFCHENDIHIDGSNGELMQKLMTSAPFDRYRWFSQSEVKAQMGRET